MLDRTALILDIFAQHARTREGQLQVRASVKSKTMVAACLPGRRLLQVVLDADTAHGNCCAVITFFRLTFFFNYTYDSGGKLLGFSVRRFLQHC